MMAIDYRRRSCLANLLSCTVLATLPFPAIATSSTLMQRNYPATGEKLPVIGLGTWQQLDHPAGSADYKEARDALAAFLDGGGRVIDSSPMYGQAEARLGDALARVKQPERAFVATKVWTGGEVAGKAQLADSQRRIGRPLDLVQIRNLLDLSVQLKTLQAAKEAGSVRSIGVTHYLASAHQELIKVLKQERPDALQIKNSVAEPEAGERLLRVAEELNIAVLINRPFAEGQLFAQVRGRPLPAVAVDLGCKAWAQLFLKWILADQAVRCVLCGTSKITHVQDNLHAAQQPLPDARQHAAIRQAWMA